MDKIKFYSGDPMIRFLMDRMHLTPAELSLISIPISLGYRLLLCWLQQPNDAIKLFQQDPLTWFWILIFTPAMTAYYLWGSNVMMDLVQNLQKSGIVDIYESDISNALELYQKRWRKFLALTIAIIMGVLYYTSREVLHSPGSEVFVPNWSSGGTITMLGGAIAVFVGTYMVNMLILALVTNVRALNQILKRKKFNINPFHPDKAGGLNFLGNYSLKVAYLAAIFAIIIVIFIYRYNEAEYYSQWVIFLGIPLYTVVSMGCFLLPLYSSHNGMKKAKGKLLNNISRQLQEAYLEAQNKLNENSETLSDDVDKIQQIRTLYDLTDRFPVWPFDVETKRKYLLAVLTPMVTVLCQIFVGYLT